MQVIRVAQPAGYLLVPEKTSGTEVAELDVSAHRAGVLIARTKDTAVAIASDVLVTVENLSQSGAIIATTTRYITDSMGVGFTIGLRMGQVTHGTEQGLTFMGPRIRVTVLHDEYDPTGVNPADIDISMSLWR